MYVFFYIWLLFIKIFTLFFYLWFLSFVRFLIIQSPTLEGKRQGGPDNPSLTDNWDDAEGYYRLVTYYFRLLRHIIVLI